MQKVVPKVKYMTYEEMYMRLDIKGWENEIYKLSKSR